MHITYLVHKLTLNHTCPVWTPFFFIQTNADNEEKSEGKARKTRPSVKQTKQDHSTSVIICHK